MVEDILEDIENYLEEGIQNKSNAHFMLHLINKTEGPVTTSKLSYPAFNDNVLNKLKKCGCVERTSRGMYDITDEGKSTLETLDTPETWLDATFENRTKKIRGANKTTKPRRIRNKDNG